MRRIMILASCGAVCVAATAWACGNAVELDLQDSTRNVAFAERALKRGRAGSAFKKALRAVRHLSEAEFEPYGDASKRRRKRAEKRQAKLLKRARRLLGLAVLRRNGNVSRRYATSVKSAKPKVRTANLQWAQGLIKSEWTAAAGKADPRLKAAYAEALAAFPNGHDQALKILRELSAADLMPDAWAYATLARLEHAKTNTDKVTAALDRCRKVAGKRAAKRICVAPGQHALGGKKVAAR